MNVKNILFLFLLFISCSGEKDKVIIASINNEVVYQNDLDKLMEQQIYDALYNIYYYRKVALKKILSDQVLSIESKKRSLSKDQLINENYHNKINFKLFYEFCEKYYHLDSARVQNIYNNFNNTQDIKANVYQYITAYKDFVKDSLIDSLYSVYNVKTFLYPPNRIATNIDSSFKFTFGNTESKVNVYYLFNTDCLVCKETFNKTIKRIVKEYKETVNFSFVPFSKDNNIDLCVLNSANQQNSFWVFFEFLMNDKNEKKINDYLLLADSLKLDLASFKQYLEYDSIFNNNLQFNYQYLSTNRFYGTPTIVINNLIVDSFDYYAIKQNIDKLLSD